MGLWEFEHPTTSFSSSSWQTSTAHSPSPPSILSIPSVFMLFICIFIVLLLASPYPSLSLLFSPSCPHSVCLYLFPHFSSSKLCRFFPPFLCFLRLSPVSPVTLCDPGLNIAQEDIIRLHPCILSLFLSCAPPAFTHHLLPLLVKQLVRMSQGGLMRVDLHMIITRSVKFNLIKCLSGRKVYR